MPKGWLKRPTKTAWKYCRQGHRLTPDNVNVSGNHRCCRLCWNRYMRDYNKGHKQGPNRMPIATCRKGHRFTAGNTHTARDGKRRCRTCLVQRNRFRAWLQKRNRRKICPNGHDMSPENTFMHYGRTKCRTCQQAHQAKSDKKHGVWHKKRPEPKNEAERWEKVLRDANLGMGRGATRLVYGENSVTGGFAAADKRRSDIRRPTL